MKGRLPRRFRCALVCGAGLWLGASTVSHSQGTNLQYIRAGRLEEWIAAIERHEPGRDDQAVEAVQAWSYGDMARVRGALPGVLQLMRDPTATFFFPEPPPGRESRLVPPLVYHPSDINSFRTAAREALARGGFNRLLKRGALLHSDIAMLRAGGGIRPATPSNTSPGFTLRFADGRSVGANDSESQWEFARLLLDMVRPDALRNQRSDPSSDPAVRSWYNASLAVLLATQQLDVRLFERAVALFPDDAGILVLSGSLHALLASPAVQDVVQSARVPSGIELRVGSLEDELRLAESLYRRALTSDMRHDEARIRLARVLLLRGRPAESARELGTALATVREPVLRYYGLLSLGRVHESLADLEQARRAYADAQALFPKAQVPRLALSQLSARSGNPQQAAEHLSIAFRNVEGDPWWTYHTSAARDVDARVARMYAEFAKATNP